jgi:hypothetical protein
LRKNPNWLLIVVLAYGAAAGGTILSFLIVKWLPDNRDPNLLAMKEDWSDNDALQRFSPRAADPKSKDGSPDPSDRARQEDERYSPE